MANPLSNEKEIYEKITKEKLKIPPVIWELLNHHLGNDLYAICVIIGSYVLEDKKDPIPPESAERILKRIEAVRAFLDKLYNVTQEK